MEAQARISCRLSVAVFGIVMSDGDICFRIGTDVADDLLSEKRADNVLNLSLFMMEQYHEPLMRVAFDASDPAASSENLREYEADLRRRKSTDADTPHRVTYKKLVRS